MVNKRSGALNVSQFVNCLKKLRPVLMNELTFQKGTN